MSTPGHGYVTPVSLDRDSFMRRLIASLGHLNEAVLGSDVAGAYIMNVGLSMGAAIEAEYKRFWQIERPFTLDEYAHVIVDLKQKIKGNFSLVSRDEERVVVRTTSCPFDAFVRESPSLCFMTSSVFGGIAARNFGWAKVVLHQRIALGDPGCYVTVYLKPTPEARAAIGREYTPEIDRASPDVAEQLRLMDSVRHLRRQLGETTSRWEEVVRGASEAICVMEPDRRVLFANGAWRDLLGVEASELVGNHVDHLVHPDDRAASDAAITRALGGERVASRACRIQHRDGSWRDALASTGPLRDEAGRIVGAIVLVHDVTHERDAQRLKDEFVSTASHELRTPVTTIKAIADLLLRGIARDGAVTTEDLARRLEMIRGEADRLALLANDLLDATRLGSGKLSVHPQVCDLAEIVREVVERRRAMQAGSGARVIALQPAAAPLPVAVDRARMEQVLANLLDNAIKYSPDGGEVVVALTADVDRARLTVSDRGIGIPEADLPNLFTPFYRGSNASTRNFGGLGLGLYVSRALVEAHGGEIAVEANQPRGTSVSILLPPAPAEGV